MTPIEFKFKRSILSPCILPMMYTAHKKAGAPYIVCPREEDCHKCFTNISCLQFAMVFNQAQHSLWTRNLIDKLGVVVRCDQWPLTMIKEWGLYCSSVLSEYKVNTVNELLPKAATCLQNIDFTQNHIAILCFVTLSNVIFFGLFKLGVFYVFYNWFFIKGSTY